MYGYGLICIVQNFLYILYIGITLRNINIIIIFKNIENYQIEYFQNLH